MELDPFRRWTLRDDHQPLLSRSQSGLAALRRPPGGRVRHFARRGRQRHPQAAAWLVCAGSTELQGSLHNLGWYPGLSLQGTQMVLAEVYPLDDDLELALDGIEGLWPHNLGEYAKRLLTVPLRARPGTLEVHNVQVLVYEALPQALQNTA